MSTGPKKGRKRSWCTPQNQYSSSPESAEGQNDINEVLKTKIRGFDGF